MVDKNNKQKVYFIYSGKGGVGKSTLTFNLASLLKKTGNSVGILDLDLKTPSIYKLFSLGNESIPPRIDQNTMQISPARVNDILVQSTGYINSDTGVLFDDDLIEGAFYQLLSPDLADVDYLLIDLPPSIEKVHSLACKNFPDAKFVLVSTYSLVSLEDSFKAYNFIKTFNMGISCLILNMSYIICNKCGDKQYLFNEDNILNFTELNHFKKFELPFSQELISANEKSLSVSSISNQSVKNAFDQILEYIEK